MRLRQKWLAPLLILALGALGAAILIATAPEAEMRPVARRPPVVRVLEVETRDLQLTVRTHGTVAPRTESDLVPQVTGPVVWVSPAMVSGGFFESGDVLLRSDPRDYEAALEQALATLARSESEHTRTQKELARQQGLAERNVSSEAHLDDAENADNVAAAGVRGARASAARTGTARPTDRETVSPRDGETCSPSCDVRPISGRRCRGLRWRRSRARGGPPRRRPRRRWR